MTRRTLLSLALVTVGCGDDPSLDDYFPPLPPPTGEPQAVFAGQVADASELIAGPAASGLVGDFFLRNDQVRVIIQGPTRVIGVIPQGGNIVDAATADGQTLDHFGELGLIYGLGRTCAPTRVDVVRDGSAGGVAVIRSIGKTGNNDFINFKGIGVFSVEPDVDPDNDDRVDCATTYILAPGSNTVEVHHSLFNPTEDPVVGPLGTIADTGGVVEAWTNARGFERADISELATLSTPQPSDYVVYQGPGIAYGVIPRHDEPVVHTQALIAGVSILLDGADSLLDILDKELYFLRVQPNGGVRQRYDLVIGRDGADVDEVFRSATGEPLRAVGGRVDLSGGGAAVGARVGVYLDGNGNGQIDDADFDSNHDNLPDDPIVTYMDVAADGTFAGNLPATGNFLVRAEVKNVGRSPAMPLADTLNLTVPSPIRVDYQILDVETDTPIPGRLLVVGDHPAFPDKRVFDTADRVNNTVLSLHAIRGTTVDVGDGVDPPLLLPANGSYRIYASRGTEWSIDSQPVTGAVDVTRDFRLRHVVATPGYLATDWHVHQIGSPDSAVPTDERLRSAVSAGVEMFAVTDHDYVSDLQPVVAELGLERLLRVVAGIEVTPFAYGHFNAWPLAPDITSASRGAIDWATGSNPNLAMIPGEIFDAMRARGAQMVQVNHPRGGGFTEFQAAFDRANVLYDFDQRLIFGDFDNADVPNDELRLPEQSLWSDQFNGLEVWNGFSTSDSNNDGLRENVSLDRVMRDWMNMLSLGLFVTPAGNSDTHTSAKDPLGMPRTLVRVADDSADALANGSAVTSVIATQTGSGGTPRDIVVTNGPMITVTVGGQPALGRVVAPTAGTVTLAISVVAPDWAEFDTIEVFANSAFSPATTTTGTVLVPLLCLTSRQLASLAAADPCKQAPIAPAAVNVQLANIPGPGNQRRYEATTTVALAAGDIRNRAGATGQDAWLVVRVRGNRAVFPLLDEGVLDNAAARTAILGGDFDTIRTATIGKGASAMAFTSPVFVDFDGGGYRAPFAP